MENNEFEEYQCEQDLTFPQQQHGRPLTFPVPQWTLANPQKQTLSRDASSAGPSRRPSSVSNSNSAFAHHLGPGPSFPIDPSLSNLSPFSGPSGSNLSSSFTDPITRFYHDSESPWIPVVTLGTVTHDGSFASYPNLPPAGLYRSAPPSEISSHDTAAFIPSDSGYGTTGCGAPSVISVSHIGSEPDYTDFPLSKVVKMAVTDDAPQEHDEIKESMMDSMKDPKLQHSPQRRMQLEKCKYCGVTPKCPSDLKKHLLKHEKPYMCGMAGCKRKGGFTTINDLLRHKKSVHKIGTTEKSYKCVAPGCKNRHKIWPRLDNFKQHVNRMHSEEDVYELIRRSQWDGQPSRSPTPRPGALVAPMETTLAGIDDHTKHTAMNVLHSPATYGISLNSASRGWNPADSTPQTLEFDDAQNESGEAVFAKARNAGAFGANIPLRSDTVSTASSTALSALAEVACGSPGMNPPDAAPRLGSGLPLPSRLKESDEERQKRALGRLSTVIANSISRKSTEESLNETILRVLSSAATGLAQPSKPKAEPDSAVVERPAERRAATQVGNGLGQGSSDVANPELDIESRDEVRQGLAALAALMKKQRGRKSSVGGRPGSALQSKGKRCPKCPLVFGRNCDLRKHLKRHERPYGCTYPKCNKSFGSKSDWKRHENSQHFQIETWRCQLYPLNRPPPEGAEHHASHHCGKLFFRSEHFKEHLGSEHSMTNESDVETQLKIRRIGRNGQGRFWCGFCHDIMELKAKRIEAWDERINHIDEHFKKGETSKHWWCMEAKKTKAEVEKQMDKRVFDDDEDDDDDEPSSPDEAEELSQNALAVEIDSDSSQGSGDDASYSVEPESAGAAPSESTMQSSVVQSPMDPYTSSKKRMISRDPSQDRKRKKYETMLFCCKCQMGPFPLKLHAACITCNHEFCTDCRKKPMRVKENEDMLEPLVSNY